MWLDCTYICIFMTYCLSLRLNHFKAVVELRMYVTTVDVSLVRAIMGLTGKEIRSLQCSLLTC